MTDGDVGCAEGEARRGRIAPRRRGTRCAAASWERLGRETRRAPLAARRARREASVTRGTSRAARHAHVCRRHDDSTSNHRAKRYKSGGADVRAGAARRPRSAALKACGIVSRRHARDVAPRAAASGGAVRGQPARADAAHHDDSGAGARGRARRAAGAAARAARAGQPHGGARPDGHGDAGAHGRAPCFGRALWVAGAELRG
ncbi:hypothetical protein FGB62_3g014 [Gracilaria domingensis]|nr:hypothetical protein FGB62_3g014 [Gracilaria domingensis]